MLLISPECCLRKVTRKQKGKRGQVDKEPSLSTCPWDMHYCTCHSSLGVPSRRQRLLSCFDKLCTTKESGYLSL